jgi:hypothetical protein
MGIYYGLWQGNLVTIIALASEYCEQWLVRLVGGLADRLVPRLE